MVSHGNHKGENFVRLVTINRENSEKNILDFFKILEKFADNNMLIS